MKSTDQNNKDDLVALFNEWAELAYGWPQGYKPRLSSVWEHGQWWIRDAESGATWSIHDAEGVGTVGGYEFEQLADGDFTAFENEKARQEEEEEEEDTPTSLLRQIRDSDMGASIWQEIDDCLKAWEGDEVALHLLQTWHNGEFQDSDWREVRELLGDE